MAQTIQIAAPRKDWLGDRPINIYNIYLPESDLTQAEAINQFLTFPVVARIVPNVRWGLIPEDATIRVYKPNSSGQDRLLGQVKKYGIASLVTNTRHSAGRLYHGIDSKAIL